MLCPDRGGAVLRWAATLPAPRWDAFRAGDASARDEALHRAARARGLGAHRNRRALCARVESSGDAEQAFYQRGVVGALRRLLGHHLRCQRSELDVGHAVERARIGRRLAKMSRDDFEVLVVGFAPGSERRLADE